MRKVEIIITGFFAVAVGFDIWARLAVKRRAGRQRAQAQALAGAFPAEYRATVGYAAWILATALDIDPASLQPKTRFLEDLKMDDLEYKEVSLVLKADGLELAPEEVMQAGAFEGFVHILTGRVPPSFFAQWEEIREKSS